MKLKVSHIFTATVFLLFAIMEFSPQSVLAETFAQKEAPTRQPQLSGSPNPLQGGAPRQSSTPELILQAVNTGVIHRDTGNLFLAYALFNDPRLPEQYHGDIPWDGTLYLLQLHQDLDAMPSSSARSAIEEAMNGSISNTVNVPLSVMVTDHFYIQYGTIGGGLTIADYANALEQAWNTQITTFGWAAPPLKSDGLYHVLLETLGYYTYGYVTPNVGECAYAGLIRDNPATPWNDKDAFASCMVLNDDYSAFPGTPLTALQATVAHEFNHSIQFGYGALDSTDAVYPDPVFIEGGATWMEDEVFDSADDNYNYLWPVFTVCMGAYPSSPYSYWITFRGLTERFGTGSAGGSEQAMQDFWEITSQETGGNLAAMNSALTNKGINLAEAFHDYAIAVKFNKPCSGGYAYPYCLEEGPAYVAYVGLPAIQGSISAVGGSRSGSIQDNYALNWISLPKTGAPYNVTLQNTSSGGQLRGSVVCDTGSSLEVKPLPSIVGPGQTTTLYYVNPSGCNSVIAVLTNQSQTSANPASCSARNYTLSTASFTSFPISLFIPFVIQPAPAR